MATGWRIIVPPRSLWSTLKICGSGAQDHRARADIKNQSKRRMLAYSPISTIPKQLDEREVPRSAKASIELNDPKLAFRRTCTDASSV